MIDIKKPSVEVDDCLRYIKEDKLCFVQNAEQNWGDNANFCPQCGTKTAGGTNIDSIVKTVDLQNMKSKTASVISMLRNLDKRKTLYGIIISFVMVILFGCMMMNALNPVKEVKADVVRAGEPYTNYSSGTFYKDTYYQQLDIRYKGKEYSGTYKIGLYNPYGSTVDPSCHTGGKVLAYIANGKLTLDKNTAEVNTLGVIFSIVLLLGSIGSCGWFILQYIKKRG